MRWALAAVTCLASTVCAVALAAEETAQRALPKLIPTRQTSFAIPFRVEAAGDAAEVPDEVQLHLSRDHGASWTQAAHVPPSAGRFSFRTEEDGEYWFMVRTRDRRGKLHPDVPAAPELRVLVDTKPPVAKLDASRGSSGEIRAQWEVDEEHLADSGVKLMYRAATDKSWQPVAVQAKNGDAPARERRGELTWWIDGIDGPIIVQLTVEDLAGNRSAVQSEIPPASASDAPAVKPADTIARPARQPESWPADQRQPAPVDGVPSIAERFPSDDLAVPPHVANSKPAPTLAEPAPRGDANPNLATKPGPKTYTPSTNPTASSSNTGRAKTYYPNSAPHEPSPTTTAQTPPSSAQPRTSAVQPPIANRYAPPVQSEWSKPTADESYGPAPGERPKRVNSRQFELEYDVEAVGSDGIGRVELWVTRDGGKNWISHGVDPDGRSPLVVSLDAEGVYGFRMVVETSTGLRGLPPRAGEHPDIWVAVDVTRPAARLTVGDPQGEVRPGELPLSWEAKDEALAERPISLAFAETKDGPWTMIASGLENSGQYEWRLDNRVPDQVYIRLEVRDDAGNVTTVVSPEPATIERIRPQGRILNVRPVTEPAVKARAVTPKR